MARWGLDSSPSGWLAGGADEARRRVGENSEGALAQDLLPTVGRVLEVVAAAANARQIRSARVVSRLRLVSPLCTVHSAAPTERERPHQFLPQSDWLSGGVGW